MPSYPTASRNSELLTSRLAWENPPLFSRPTSPVKRRQERPATTAGSSLAVETPPMTVSEIALQHCPLFADKLPLLRSSIMREEWSTIIHHIYGSIERRSITNPDQIWNHKPAQKFRKLAGQNNQCAYTGKQGKNIDKAQSFKMIPKE